jgi:hypothetical protein
VRGLRARWAGGPPAVCMMPLSGLLSLKTRS